MTSKEALIREVKLGNVNKFYHKGILYRLLDFSFIRNQAICESVFSPNGDVLISFEEYDEIELFVESKHEPVPTVVDGMDLTAFAIQIFEDNKKKGFWDKERNVGELLMLVVSELGEAIEAHRKGRVCKEQKNMELFALNVKDTFEDEIADAIIRLLDMCGGLEIDIHWHVFAKLEYNKTRERLHGKKY